MYVFSYANIYFTELYDIFMSYKKKHYIINLAPARYLIG